MSKRLLVAILLTLGVPLAVGAVGIAVHLPHPAPVTAAPSDDLDLPAARRPATALPLAVVVAGNHGTEITDSLAIVELLEASGAFEVRIVAPARRPSPFINGTGGDAGLDFVPDLSFAEVDALVGRPPALLVVPYVAAFAGADAAILPWLRAHAGPDTTVLSICRGAEVVAASGLFDGHVATANASSLDQLVARYPAVRWQRGVRWVRDGRRISSALLAAGLDATLATVEILAGRPAAERAAASTGYRHLRAATARSQAAARVPAETLLELAYRWEQTRVAVVLADGMTESAVAGALDAQANTMSATPVAVAAERRVLRTRTGLALLPRPAVEGAERVILAGDGAHGYGYDQAFSELAHRRGRAIARAAAILLNYPEQGLGGGLPVDPFLLARPIFLALVGLAAAAAVMKRRRPRQQA